MGIHNGIHDTDDDLYYYCPTRDCPCHDSYFYDASGNLYHHNDPRVRTVNDHNTRINDNIYSPRLDDLNNIQYNHVNNTSTATCLGASINHNNGSTNHHNNDI